MHFEVRPDRFSTVHITLQMSSLVGLLFCSMHATSYDLVKDVPQWRTGNSGEEMTFTVPQSGLRVYWILTAEARTTLVVTIDNGQPQTAVMTEPTSAILPGEGEFVSSTYKIRATLPGGGQWKIVIVAMELVADCSRFALMYDNAEGTISLTGNGCRPGMCALLLSASESATINMRLQSEMSLDAYLFPPGSLVPTPKSGSSIDLSDVSPGSILTVRPTSATQTELSSSIQYTTSDSTCAVLGGIVDPTWSGRSCPAVTQVNVGCSQSNNNGDNKPPLGAIIGGVVGALVVIGIVVGVVVFFVMKSKAKVPENTPETAY